MSRKKHASKKKEPQPVPVPEEQAPASPRNVYRLKLDRWDYAIMAALTLAYLAVALVNLGRLNVPTTGWKPVKAGEGFTVDLGHPRDLSRIYYYDALGEGRDASGTYSVQYKDAAGNYEPLATIEKKDVFTWKYAEVPPVRTERLKITVIKPGGTLNEIAFFEKGKTTPIRDLKVTDVKSDPGDGGKVADLFDEQGSVEYTPSFMSDFYFDEIYHARTGYEFVHHIDPFDTAHPPLGKDFIALGILLFGMVPFGWRIAGTLFGAAMLPAMYIFGKRLFADRFSAFAAMFLMAFDFMHFTLTRIATVDSYPTLFIILMYYFMLVYFSRKPWEAGYKESLMPLMLCGLLFGFGSAAKWIAVFGAPGLAFLFFLAKYNEYSEYARLRRKGRRLPWMKEFKSKYLYGTALWCVVFFFIIPAVIYTLAYIPFFMVPGPWHGLADIPRLQEHMYQYHSTLTETHPFQSRWWKWPLMLKPVWLYMGQGLPAGKASSIVTLGNPAIWWLGIPAVVAAVIIAIKKRARNMVVVFTAMASQYLPWAFISRSSFIYHFFSILPFMILAIVYVLKNMAERYRWGRYAAWGYLAAVAVLFVAFYPVLSGMVVNASYISHLRWLKGWYF